MRYIFLGDFFDAWIGDDVRTPLSTACIIEAFQQLRNVDAATNSSTVNGPQLFFPSWQ